MSDNNYKFETILRDYCKLKDIKLTTDESKFNVDKIMTDINSLIEDEFFNYSMVTQSFNDINKLPKLFILQDTDDQYYLIERVNNNFISLKHHRSVNAEHVLNRKVTYLYSELKNFTASDITLALLRRTPWIGLLGIVLIFFALLIPLYSNLFNSRLIYSDNFNSLLYITFIFIFLVIAEIILRVMIYNWRSKVVHANQLFFDDFILFNLDRYKSKSIVSDWRVIERSATIMWEGITQIAVDLSSFILFVLVVVFLTGTYSLILFSYYAIFVVLCLWIRFRAYKKSLENYKFENDKLLDSISLVANRNEFKFYNISFLRERFHFLNKKNEHNRHGMSIENSRWSELIRANSFISLMVMFMCAYLAIRTGILPLSATIALMIINGRMSGSLVSSINISYNILSNWHHAQKSLVLLFDKSFEAKNRNSITIDNLTELKLQRFTYKIHEFEVLQDYNATFVPGNVIGIVGPVGAGKTTLLNFICGKKDIEDGSILYNGVNVEEVSELFFNQKVCYYKPGINFLRGNLAMNFNLHYVFSEQEMIKILRKVNPYLQITHDLLYKADVDDIPLSNGEKQKLILLMMIAKKPELIILDEPTSFLSRDDSHEIINFIIANNKQAIILLATHDTSLHSFMTEMIQLNKIRKTESGGLKIEVPTINFN